jgi:hypothetical protein
LKGDKIGVVVDDPLPPQQRDMLAAVQAAAEWAHEQKPHVQHIKIRPIHVSSVGGILGQDPQMKVADKLAAISVDEDIQVFIDLR